MEFNVQPEIRFVESRQLIGMKMEMSMVENKTGSLWQSFKSRRNEIIAAPDSTYYSLQQYPADYFASFHPEKKFIKWAAVETPDFSSIPAGMDQLYLEEGVYAVFLYRGSPKNAGPFFNHIFNSWLPASGYQLDDRLHFELLGEKYLGDHVDSEEEVFVPVRQ